MGDWRTRVVLFMVVWGGVAAAHTVRPAQDFLAIGNALRTFQIGTGRYPTEEEGLKALVGRPANWPEGLPWKRVMLKEPSDPWGNSYFYVTSPNSGEAFGLYSMGRDGVSHSKGNDPDDWNTWSKEHQEEYGRRDSWMNRLKKNAVLFSLAMATLVLAAAAAIRGRRKRRIA